jgi:hypothetical protein
MSCQWPRPPRVRISPWTLWCLCYYTTPMISPYRTVDYIEWSPGIAEALLCDICCDTHTLSQIDMNFIIIIIIISIIIIIITQLIHGIRDSH